MLCQRGWLLENAGRTDGGVHFYQLGPRIHAGLLGIELLHGDHGRAALIGMRIGCIQKGHHKKNPSAHRSSVLETASMLLPSVFFYLKIEAGLWR